MSVSHQSQADPGHHHVNALPPREMAKTPWKGKDGQRCPTVRKLRPPGLDKPQGVIVHSYKNIKG